MNTKPALAAELVARCFTARTATHIAHLRTRSYSAHMALEAFYEGIVDLADEFAEVYQGHFAVIDEYDFAAPDIYTDTVKQIEELCDWATKNRNAIAQGRNDLGNLIDEITALCGRTVYKLKNLK